jgi:hypothetical protein
MILKAIMDQLKTGSIVTIYTRGNYQTYLNGRNTDDNLEPYIVVYDDYAVDAYYLTDNTVMPFVVEAHWPTGYINELNTYIENELPLLLNRKRLTDNEGYTFQTFVTAYLSIMSEPNDDRSITGGNDDGSISKYRRIFVPRRGL